MSFKGYYQVLCENGHERHFDAYEMPEIGSDGTSTCSCGKSYVYLHLVDTTNGEDDPIMFAIKDSEIRQTCDLGHSHIIQEQTFKIPIKEEK